MEADAKPSTRRPVAGAGEITFISYDAADSDPVQAFLETHRTAFDTIRTVGVTPDDSIASSADEQLILDEIARRYIADADLTVVLIGADTWTRRFVDWEIAAAAHQGCAILAVPLHAQIHPIPARVRLLAEAQRAVVAGHSPTSTSELASWIEAARDPHRRSMHTGALRAMKTPLMHRDARVIGH